MSNNAFSRRFSSFDIWSRSNSKSTIEETHDRIYPLPTVTSHIAPAMSMQKPMERKVAWSLIRICRNIGHCGSMTIPFPSRLFDQFGQSVIDERLRGSLIFFLYPILCISAYVNTFFWERFLDLQMIWDRSNIVALFFFFLWLLLHSMTHFHLLSSAIFTQYTQQKLSNDQTILLVIPSKRCAI